MYVCESLPESVSSATDPQCYGRVAEARYRRLDNESHAVSRLARRADERGVTAPPTHRQAAGLCPLLAGLPPTHSPLATNPRLYTFTTPLYAVAIARGDITSQLPAQSERRFQ